MGLGLSSESDTESEASFSPPIPIPSDVSFALSSLADFLSPTDPHSLMSPKDKEGPSSKGCLQAPGSPSKGSGRRMAWAKNVEARLEADREGMVPVARFVPSAISSTSTGWFSLFLSFFFKQPQHRSKPPKPTPAPNIPLHILLLLLEIISTIARGIKYAVLTGVKELDTALLQAVVEGAVNTHVEVGKTGIGACVAFLYLYMMISGEETNA
ncbi:hypothetical protein CNBF4590 [Cryptococcus deneoformans B-3501A]|uniref:hypothetical protein n=1 Tax=Cryptococcus deneoformans (strain B-3501A) TaxID=283643 RepID=UPI000042EF90|nr:hypothetical protein CNBF4590 [Cryptococcus neoformans var. neoformans B-3501A]EAL19923.1 hypothetical protein CNBF4590 [Cryptococcus neoformans var. neoformans B-3501A]